jgi:signal transduction histidine kinase/CheY-like chemotaxis protein
MRTRCIALVAGLAMATASPARAQARVGDLYESWRWVHFGPESGLPPGRLLEVLESDTTAYLVSDMQAAWFDGYRWRPLQSPEGVPPTRLTPDGRGGAYGIAGGKLVRVSPSGIETVAVPLPAGSRVGWVARIGDGDLLLLAADSIWRLRGDSLASVPGPTPDWRAPPGRSSRLLRTRPGHVWLLGAGVWRWDDGEWTPWASGYSHVLRETAAGGLLATTGQRDSVYSWGAGGRPALLPPLEGIDVSAMSLSRDGTAVIVYWEGRVAVRVGDEWSWLWSIPEGLELARQLVHRANGDLWALGTHGLSLFRASARRWAHARIPDRSEASGVVNAILRSRAGELWLGTGQGLLIEGGGRRREILAIQGVPLGAVTGLAEDTAGGIWVTSGSGARGAFRWDGRSWAHHGPAQGLGAPWVHRVVADREGGLWFLGLDSVDTGPGAFRWDGSRFTRWGPSEGLQHGRVYAFGDAPDGTLWFGTAQGLSRWRRGSWTHWPLTAEGVVGRVYALALDRAGKVWFGHMQAGFGIGTITPDDRVEYGLLDVRAEVSDLRQSPDGVLWFASQLGLGRMAEGRVAWFGRSSGLENPRLMSVLPLADRVLAGGDGIYTLDLAESSLPAPEVDIAAPLAYPSEVLLRWTPLAYGGATPSSEIETRYRVDEGLWSEWGLTRQISLFKLGSGRHRVEVEAKGLFGQVASRPAAATFTLPAPWYRRWPFLVATVAGVGLFVLVLVLYWRRQEEHRAALERLNRALADELDERRRSEAARQTLETQLAQAQRMETVGRLAGGIAHDFNNILTAISGYAEVARVSLPDSATDARRDLEEIVRAAGRAQALTSQLLTFARRQVVAPRVIDLNVLVARLESMLHRLVGGHVELVVQTASDLGATRADPTQLEQVLINLAVNARDAMPAGGRLLIRTSNAPPGWRGKGRGGEELAAPAVLVEVIDSGEGMAPEVLAHAFEPFFTTKPPGEGTGLGLATCYGIVRAAGGVILVESTPGHGTSFVVALPRIEAPPEPTADRERDGAPGGHEVVLLVEDEEPVRELASRILRRRGYQVREARSGRNALELLERDNGRQPDLLITDVVMPEMGGPELWTALHSRYPALRVLFISGYPDSPMVRQGVAQHSLPFLPKPFTVAELARKVREVLDG